MRIFTSLALWMFSIPLLAQTLSPYPAYVHSIPFVLQNESLQGLVYTPPQATGIRAAAQFEEQQGVAITWTSYTHILAQIVAAARTEVTVYIVCSDSNAVKTYLNAQSVPLSNIRYLEDQFNTIWARDYGMNSIYLHRDDSLSFVDWRYNRPRPKDDTVPYALARMLGAPLYSTSQVGGNYLVNTGGNYMSDGQGTAFASKLILDDNQPGAGYGGNATEAQIDTMMKQYMGIQRYIKMEKLPHDGIHHIDMHMKLLDEETLLIGQYPDGVSDGPQIEANIGYIQNNFMDCYGRPYKIIRIPQPPDNTGAYPDAGGEYCTYTNAIILNHTVIYPHYYTQYDTTADRIWHESMPGYRLCPINCENGADDIISQSGAIHCITHELGVSDPILIAHAHLPDTYNFTVPYSVIARVETHSGVNSATLYWSIDSSLGYTAVTMTPLANDSFLSYIPAQPVGTRIFYYLEATSLSGRTNRKPMVAPQGVFTFQVLDQSLGITSSQPAGLTRFFNPMPNPAGEKTLLSFQLPAAGMVDLGVYDLTGRLVMSLIREKMLAGVHQYMMSTTLLP